MPASKTPKAGGTTGPRACTIVGEHRFRESVYVSPYSVDAVLDQTEARK